MESKIEKDYEEALEFLYSQLPMFSRTGAAAYKPGLDTSIALSGFFGDPHKKFKSIHIGGTNGKGSTSSMIASVLQSQGYKTGLYTSPHLIDFRERMRINGKMIPKEKVVEFVRNWRNSNYEGQPSFFELTMIMAFNWFAEENVDYAVIEVGMGGRLDSTNIITPLLSVITNISHDHNQFLGDTLEKIAMEKAGIIKPKIPVVIGETQMEPEKVFRHKALETNAPIVFADQVSGIECYSSHDGWRYDGDNFTITLPLGGDYQKKNLITVLGAINELRKLGIAIEDRAIQDGIENVTTHTGFLGRWMIISHEPLTIADTGHNIAGISYNISQLLRKIKEREGGKLRIVIGFVADKAIDKILKLLPKQAEYYITNAQIPRALPAEKLAEKFEEAGLSGRTFTNVWDAYNTAKKEASVSDIIFIGGSTFIVADFLHYAGLYAGHDSSTGCC
ncbi:MAG: bifunctional folylpolyglutamate synthase/dihydrofolate synthase [Muribaculaceae bacterium]|nr:bifunctional folylpolyglutamate synthase/dihydrofolate synthase [Muribaculaceae bacterium]